MSSCHIFSLADPNPVPSVFLYDVIEDYGESCCGHSLHTWDDGERMLVRCRECGAYVLIQRSEFHSFSDAPDSYYIDYFDVSGAEEARELNQRYDGYALESSFTGKHIALVIR